MAGPPNTNQKKRGFEEKKFDAFLSNFMKMYLYFTVEQYVKFVFTRMFTSYWACQNNADFVLNTYIHANVNESI